MSHEIRSISDTVVAVTGASSGIGRAVARQLAEAGARVVVTARRGDRLEALVTEYGPDRIASVAGDIADPGTSRRLVKTAVDRFGRLDSIVLAAGVGMYGGALANTDAELADMTSTNFLGTVWGVRSALPAMKEGGDIVVVASVAGLRGSGNEAVYAGTKAAQVVFARAVDREVRTEGVRVTTICPAAVNTEFAIGKGRTEGDPQLSTFMAPEDIAAAIVYTLQQPRRLRTTQWDMWSAVEAS